jgi:hypothetical protein
MRGPANPVQGMLKQFIASALFVIASAEALAAVQMQVGSVSGPAGTSVSVPISLQSDTPVTAFQVDIVANPPVITFDAATDVESLATHVADVGLVAPGVFRVLTYSVFNAPIPNGLVLTLQAAISPLATNGPVSLVLSNAIISSPSGVAIANSTVAAGTLNVGAVSSLRLSNFSLTGGNLQFQVSGLSGSSFTVESSIDLASWKTFATRQVSAATASFSSAVPVGDKRQFFRVKTP